MTTATSRSTLTPGKNKLVFYLRISQLSRSVQYACRSQNLLKLDM